MNEIEVPEKAAIVGASLLKMNARAYYEQNRTESADYLNAYARQLCDNADIEWSELDEVEL